jgi:hypothetical protein
MSIISDQLGMPKLMAPGAGLPLLERLFFKHVWLPLYCLKASWAKSEEMFEIQGEKILKRCRSLPTDKLFQKVLISRIPGIEDSSRFWSVAMTLEHMIIVGNEMKDIIISLSQGFKPQTKIVSTAQVKPKGLESDSEKVISNFKTFLNEYSSAMNNKIKDQKSDTTFAHPWFGELSIHQWHSLASIHLGLHGKQIHEICKNLK